MTRITHLRLSPKEKINLLLEAMHSSVSLLQKASLTLTNMEMIIFVTMNFSSGKSHVIVASLEICFHIENSKN